MSFLLVNGTVMVGSAFATAAETNKTSAVRHYAIVPGTLNDVLAQFAGTARIPLSFDPKLLEGMRSNGLQGQFTISSGFRRLLSGSGFEAVNVGSGKYVLKSRSSAGATSVDGLDSSADAVTLAAIQAKGEGGLPEAYVGGQVARGSRIGMLGNKDFMETPFSVTSYTNETIIKQQAQTVSDVLVNDPSVGLEGSKSGWFGNFNIRGFTVQSNDTSINGIAGLQPQNLQIPIEFIERVDVLRGPTALLSGMAPNGAISGLVNVETKRATAEPLTRVGVGYISDSQFGTHIDLGRRFGQNNEWGIRVNGSVQGGDQAVDDQLAKRRFGSIGLDYAGERFRFGLDAYTSSTEFRGGPVGVQLARNATAVPRAPKNSTNLWRDKPETNSRANLILAQGEYDLNDNWTIKAGVGHAVGKAFGGPTGSFPTNVDGDGNYTGRLWAVPSIKKSTVYFAGLTGKFSTGPISHQPAINFQRIAIDNYYQQASSATWTGNIYDPGIPPYDMPELGSPPKTAKTVLQGIAITDTLGFFDDRLQVTVGVRRQSVEVDNFDGTTGALTSRYDVFATTPMAAVVAKINDNWSVYANYAEGLSQGSTVGDGYENSGEVFPPYKTKQYEAGVKWDGGSFANTLSVFQLTKPSAITDSSTAPLPTYRLDGEQRNRGVEWQFFGQPFERIRVLGGVIYTQGKLTRTQDGLTDGNIAVGVPKWRASAGIEYDVPGMSGLTLSGRWTHASSQYVNTTNTLKIGSWDRFDVGARYGTKIAGRKVNFYANVENVANKSYWEGATGRQVTLGWPRTFRLSATIDF